MIGRFGGGNAYVPYQKADDESAKPVAKPPEQPKVEQRPPPRPPPAYQYRPPPYVPPPEPPRMRQSTDLTFTAQIGILAVLAVFLFLHLKGK